MMRTDQSVRDLTEKHRYARATGDEQGASRYKKMMTSFGVAARFEGGRQQKHIVEFTGLSLVDIDHIAPERMTEILEKVREDEHTLLAYTTLSGQGLRILFRYAVNRTTDCTDYTDLSTDGSSTSHSNNQCNPSNPWLDNKEYRQVFEQGNEYYSNLVDIDYDHQCKNIGRISTIAYDEHLYYNPDATPFIVKLEEKKPVGRPKRVESGKMKVERCEALVLRELEQRDVVYAPGSHNKYISDACYMMNRYGVSLDDCTAWALDRFGDYQAEGNDVASIVRSCYTQTEEHGTARLPQNKSDKQASVAQIEAFLAERVQLRRNVVTGFVEVKEASPLQTLAPQDSLGELKFSSSQPTLFRVGPRRGDSDSAGPSSPPWEGLGEALNLLMECKAPDGRYLVTRKVHWQAVYRVLVDEGWYDASLGYAAFVDYIRSVAPPGGFRIMPDVETIRHISQTLYARPFAKWRYDAAYHTKRWAYERMRAVAEALLGVMGEEKNDNISQ